jgi:hypothetical protein
MMRAKDHEEEEEEEDKDEWYLRELKTLKDNAKTLPLNHSCFKRFIRRFTCIIANIEHTADNDYYLECRWVFGCFLQRYVDLMQQS